MRSAIRQRIVVAGAAVVAALAWSLSPSQAKSPPEEQFGGAGAVAGMAGADDSDLRPGRVYVQSPINAETAKTWGKLNLKIPMNFEQETSLEDVVKYIKDSTRDEKDKDSVLQIYVDPVGLQEAEKTMTSPITLSLQNVPLATSLELILKQLDLSFSVQKDGILMITHSSSVDSVSDPNLAILDELSALRAEVKALRTEISYLRPAATGTAPATVEMHSGTRPAGGGSGGMGGGMGGGFR